MEKKHLILLAESNLQSNLIKKQLSSIHDVDVKIMQPDEVVFRSHSLSIDLMFIDYDFMRQLEVQGKLPDFDLFGWSFMLHNVPCEKVQTDLLHWKLLKGILLRSASVTHICDGAEYVLKGGLWLPRMYLEKLVLNYRHANLSEEQQHEQEDEPVLDGHQEAPDLACECHTGGTLRGDGREEQGAIGAGDTVGVGVVRRIGGNSLIQGVGCSGG